MSKPRYDWWPYAKGMIRRYPQLKQEYEELHRMSTTQKFTDEPRGSEMSRTLESVAIRELPHNKQREYEAVRRAIEETKKYKNGLDRLQVIKLVLWKRTHTLEGAALSMYFSDRTVVQWHGDFIRLVAEKYGLLD